MKYFDIGNIYQLLDGEWWFRTQQYASSETNINGLVLNAGEFVVALEEHQNHYFKNVSIKVLASDGNVYWSEICDHELVHWKQLT